MLATLPLYYFEAIFRSVIRSALLINQRDAEGKCYAMLKLIREGYFTSVQVFMKIEHWIDLAKI